MLDRTGEKEEEEKMVSTEKKNRSHKLTNRAMLPQSNQIHMKYMVPWNQR